GYKHYDHNWKSSETLVRMLVDIASKGGNLLLNVGPTSEGLIPGPSVERLEAMGEWMAINSESIYGTDASPFFKLPWGRCTSRKTSKGMTFYFHVFDWPEDNVIRVPGVKTKVKKAFLLGDKDQKLSSGFEQNTLLIDLPEAMPDPVNTVVVVETKGNLAITSNMPALIEGKIVLQANFADIHNPGYGTHALLKGTDDEALITNWVDPRAWMEWMFNSTEPGMYSVEAMVKADQSSKLTIGIGEHLLEAAIQATDGKLKKINLGEIEIPGTGDLLLAFRPDREEWNGIELVKVMLVKQ
ncbi:MAG: alpha-L-fucosidase, partial [Bacteroidales bacterium]|nr:alpha-L-fucosidase [Bacteroidales bacterium]